MQPLRRCLVGVSRETVTVSPGSAADGRNVDVRGRRIWTHSSADGRPGRFNTEAYDRDRRQPVPRRAADDAALDVLDRRRHRVVRQRPPLPERGPAAAAGRGADRGAGQLLPLRLPAAGGRRSPFSVTIEVAACPWKPEHRLVRIGLQGAAHRRRATRRRATSCS